MQLLFEQSYEFNKCPGLGLISGEVLPLKNYIKSQRNSIIPNIGWHKLKSSSKLPFFFSLKNKSFYCIHCILHWFTIHFNNSQQCSTILESKMQMVNCQFTL